MQGFRSVVVWIRHLQIGIAWEPRGARRLLHEATGLRRGLRTAVMGCARDIIFDSTLRLREMALKALREELEKLLSLW